MKRTLALFGLAALCGCGNSNRVVMHSQTTEIGVSRPYTIGNSKSR